MKVTKALLLLSFHETSKIRTLAFALTLWTIFRGNELLFSRDNEESKTHPKSDLLSLSLAVWKLFQSQLTGNTQHRNTALIETALYGPSHLVPFRGWPHDRGRKGQLGHYKTRTKKRLAQLVGKQPYPQVVIQFFSSVDLFCKHDHLLSYFADKEVELQRLNQLNQDLHTAQHCMAKPGEQSP